MDNKEAVKRLLLLLGRYKKTIVVIYRVKSMRSADQQANHGRWLYWRK